MMKTRIILSLAAALCIGVVLHSDIAFAKKDGAPSGSTGSPGDGASCAKVGCHTGSETVSEGVITTTVPAEGYLSGETYSITVELTSETRNRFGFQLSPQNLSGDQLGELIVTDASRTKLTGGGKYITHNLSSIDGTDGTISWTFDWVPTESSGDVTFYAAYNVGNGNGTASGDSIYVTSLTISEDPANNPVSIEEFVAMERVILVNPVKEQLVMNTSDIAQGTQLLVVNLNGSIVMETQSMLTRNQQVDVSGLLPGTYLLVSESGVAGKFVKL